MGARGLRWRDLEAHFSSYMHALKSEESRKKAILKKAMKSPLAVRVPVGTEFLRGLLLSYRTFRMNLGWPYQGFL